MKDQNFTNPWSDGAFVNYLNFDFQDCSTAGQERPNGLAVKSIQANRANYFFNKPKEAWPRRRGSLPYSSKVGSRSIPRSNGPKIMVQAETGEKPLVPKEPVYKVRMDQIRSKVDINSVKYDKLTDVWKKQNQRSVPPPV
jgi:hypothetical protein